MNRRETPIPGLLVFEPPVFRDHRGLFLETWNEDRYPSLPPFVQDNLSRSRQGVVRGLHYQHPRGQGKLITAVHGAVWDVAVDLRRGSPSFGRWWGTRLDDDGLRQLYVPPGLAHGFVALTADAILHYKCTERYAPGNEHTLRWDDPDVGIDWPVDEPILSDKDRAGSSLAELEAAALPGYEG